LNLRGRRVAALVGDGSFGFLAMELETAVRKKARVVYVVPNNEGWNIDRHDQQRNYLHVAGV
jgi:acetolactate synthase-1/2/3 large subunit